MSGRYLVPARITLRREAMPGVGGREIAAGAVGVAVGVAAFMLLGLLGLPLPIQALAGLLPAGVGVGLAAPLPDGSHLLDLALAVRDFRGRRKMYFFDHRRDV